MKKPIGIGLWIAYPSKVNIEQLKKDCEKYHITWLAVKTGDIVRVPNNVKFIRTLINENFQVYTWNYSTPTRIDEQIDHIARNINDGALGHIVNGEVEWDNPSVHKLAESFVTNLKLKLPDTFLSHAPFAYKNYHPYFPYDEFNQLGSVMPQEYWTAFDNSGAMYHSAKLKKVWTGCEVPVYPIGVSYDSTAGFDKMPGVLTADDVKLFFDECYWDQAISFYSYEAGLKVPAFWDGLSKCQYKIYEEKIELLNR